MPPRGSTLGKAQRRNYHNMERQIRLTTEDRRAVLKETGLTEGALSLALTFRRHGEQSERARQLAMERGGMVYCTAPECETIHDADGKMVQTFGNGAVITVDKASSEATLEHNGKLVATYHNVTLQMLSLIQATAAELK